METPLPTIIQLFVAAKQTEGKSPKTTQWYADFLNRFCETMQNGQPLKLKDFSLNPARAFVATLQKHTVSWQGHPVHPEVTNGLSPYTVHAYVRVLKVFSGWLYEEGFTSINVLAKLKRLRLPQPMIEILGDEEQKALFVAINPNCFLGARLVVIALLLLDTGTRASELCTLTIDNVHLDEGYVKFFGKGDKERIIPTSNKTKMALMRYTNAWRPQSISDAVGELILTTEDLPTSYPGLRQVIKRLRNKAGIPRLHPHLFRHTFAVNYLMNGGDVMTLKLILGHTTLEVTQVYMHLAESHVKIQHSRFSPVEKLDVRVTGRERNDHITGIRPGLWKHQAVRLSRSPRYAICRGYRWRRQDSAYGGFARIAPPTLRADGRRKIYVGEGAHAWGRPVENLDFDRLGGSPEMLSLFLGAVSRYSLYPEAIDLVVGLPIATLMGENAANTQGAVKTFLKCTHKWEADGKPCTLTVESVKVTSQPVGALFDYLLRQC